MQKLPHILFSALVCYFLFVQPFKSLSQDRDSLKKTIKYNKSREVLKDTSTINTLIDIAKAHSLTEPDSTYKYATQALIIAQKINDIKGLLNANYQIGRVHFFRGQYQKVLEVADQSLKEIDRPGFEKEKALTNQLAGMAHASQGRYQQGLGYFLKAKDLFEELDEDLGMFENMNNIGVSYLKLEDYSKALDIFLELDSLRTLEATTISIPVNLGFIYFELGNYQKAEEHLKRVLNFDEEIYDRRALGLTTFKLGEIYKEHEEYQRAINSFNKSIKIYAGLNNQVKKVPAMNGIALSYLREGLPKKALPFAEKAFKIANNLNALPEKNSSAETLYKIYERLNNSDLALKYHVMHKELSDSLLNAEISKEVGRLEAEHEFEQRELELKEIQKQENLQNEKIVADQRSSLIIVLALLLISILVGIQFLRNSILRKNANEILKEKNKEIESQAERLKELNEIKTHIFSIISHDLRGPLSSLSGFIELYEANALSHDEVEMIMPKIADKFKYTSSLLNNLLSWAKSQLEGYQTNPEEFSICELTIKVFKLIQLKSDAKNITVINSVNKDINVLADKNMIELVLLNLISNAVKFTPENGEIEIHAFVKEDTARISVTDTGVGIQKEKIDLLLADSSFYTTKGTNNEEGTGIGLMLCRDFIEKNHGKLWIKSEVGSGSTFTFSLPAAQRKELERSNQLEVRS